MVLCVGGVDGVGGLQVPVVWGKCNIFAYWGILIRSTHL